MPRALLSVVYGLLTHTPPPAGDSRARVSAHHCPRFVLASFSPYPAAPELSDHTTLTEVEMGRFCSSCLLTLWLLLSASPARGQTAPAKPDYLNASLPTAK